MKLTKINLSDFNKEIETHLTKLLTRPKCLNQNKSQNMALRINDKYTTRNMKIQNFN